MIPGLYLGEIVAARRSAGVSLWSGLQLLIEVGKVAIINMLLWQDPFHDLSLGSRDQIEPFEVKVILVGQIEGLELFTFN